MSDYEYESESDYESGDEMTENVPIPDDEMKETGPEDEDLVFSYKQLEQIGHARTDDLEDVMFTDRKNIATLSGREKFIKNVKEFLATEKINIQLNISKLENIEYKNPKAFVVASFFIENRKKDEELFETIEKYLKDVQIEDVIRYIRMLRKK